METIIHALGMAMVPLIWLAVLTGLLGIVRSLSPQKSATVSSAASERSASVVRHPGSGVPVRSRPQREHDRCAA